MKNNYANDIMCNFIFTREQLCSALGRKSPCGDGCGLGYWTGSSLDPPLSSRYI